MMAEVLSRILKTAALRFLPDGLLGPIKRRHYFRVISTISERDEPDLAVLKYLVSRDDVVADIGANIGAYTKFLSELVGEKGKVYALEPIPQTYQYLTYNIAGLRLNNVVAIPAAISDNEGSAAMTVPEYETGGLNYYQATLDRAQRGPRSLSVRTISLDSLFAESPQLSFIKLDVEGHELCCLRGASKLIEASKPAWLIELSSSLDDPSSEASAVVSLLEQSSYKAYFFDGTRLCKHRMGEKSINYFFLQPEQIACLKAVGLVDDS